jgi:ABC-type transport system involved in multi-copper enzyme maturation permease subunit
MTTTTADVKPARPSLPPAKGKAGLAGAIASEWTKLRTVRSTYWTLVAFVVVCVGLTAGVCYAAAYRIEHPVGHEQLVLNATAQSLRLFTFLGPLILMVLGALVVTSEYSTGMIRTSLTAQPRRGNIFAAKLAVFAAVAVVLSVVTAFVSYLLGQQVLKSTGQSTTLSDPNVLRAVVGAALYVAVLGVMAYAIGLIFRHTAAAIATMAGIIFVLPLVTALLPADWSNDVTKWIPTSAGDALLQTAHQDPTLFSPWAQFGVTAGYAVILLIIGAFLLRKRDA